jgi:hypothetical protein
MTRLDRIPVRPTRMTRALAFGGLILLAPANYSGQTPGASSTSQQTTQPSAADQAAARRKKFEEDRKRLETGESEPIVTPSEPDATFFVSPAKVNMLVGQTQPFGAFDINGKTQTGSAEWSLSSSTSATFNAGGSGPEILAKATGHFTVRAKLGSRYAEADVTVLEGTSLPTGSIRWTAAEIPGYKTKQVVPAVPSPNGPDVFVNEEGADGTSLIRAFTSDGIQLWMTRSNQRVEQVIPTFGSGPPRKP